MQLGPRRHDDALHPGMVGAGIVCVSGASLALMAPRVRATGDIGFLHVQPGIFDVVAAVTLVVPVLVVLYLRWQWDVDRKIRETVRAQALHDPLTGLPNREALNTWAGLSRRPMNALGVPCVMFVDLDRFKYVNDTHGHRVGDQLLVAVAGRLRGCVREGDVVVRSGGDEFIVLCADMLSAPAAVRTAERLTAAVRAPIQLGREQICISATIGIALADRKGLDLDHLIHHADRAMYRAKVALPGSVVVAAGEDVEAPFVTEADLRRAIDGDELVLHYQPIIRLADGALVGVEALLRWQHPRLGLLQPGAFVSLLEESGLIVPAGTWVLRQAARQSRLWQDRARGHPALQVSVNVSPRQLNQADFTQMARQALADGGARPTNLCLEITEGALLRDPDAAWTALRQLKALGVSLALDDFGTGFSSLSYIRRFDLDVLKIDRSFVMGVHESSEDRAIVEHVIGLAHALGMVAVAEGIEHHDQAEVLQQLGCDAVQGYLYSKAVPAAEIDELLDGQRCWPSSASRTRRQEILDLNSSYRAGTYDGRGRR